MRLPIHLQWLTERKYRNISHLMVRSFLHPIKNPPTHEPPTNYRSLSDITLQIRVMVGTGPLWNHRVCNICGIPHCIERFHHRIFWMCARKKVNGNNEPSSILTYPKQMRSLQTSIVGEPTEDDRVSRNQLSGKRLRSLGTDLPFWPSLFVE